MVRRQPVRIVDGKITDGYTDLREVICFEGCGDRLDLDYQPRRRAATSQRPPAGQPAPARAS
jgi:hypothetical protein